MLSKYWLIPLTLIITCGLATLDFFMLRKISIVFYIHTVATLIFGSTLVFFSYKLLKQKSGNEYVNMFMILIGLIQFTIHFVILFVRYS